VADLPAAQPGNRRGGRTSTRRGYVAIRAQAGMPGRSLRFRALAASYAEVGRTGTTEIGDVRPQVVRGWVVQSDAQGPEGFLEAVGQRSCLTERHRAALAASIERGRIPVVHGVVRMRIIDLCQ
jgi:hypothetical protein